MTEVQQSLRKTFTHSTINCSVQVQPGDTEVRGLQPLGLRQEQRQPPDRRGVRGEVRRREEEQPDRQSGALCARRVPPARRARDVLRAAQAILLRRQKRNLQAGLDYG